MKKFLLSLIVLVSISQIYAQTSQLLISENFTGYSNGNLNGQGGWTATGNSDYVQVATTTPLTYSGYTSGTQYVNVTQRADYGSSPTKRPDDPYKSFTGGNISVNTGNTTFYMSFLVRVPNTTGVQTTGNARPTVALRGVNGSNLANFYIGDASSGTALKFGIAKDGSQDGTYAGGSYSFGTTYLVVIRYDVVNGGWSNDFDDRMYMWINPSLSGEPSTASAQVAIDNIWDFNDDGGFSGAIQSLQLFQQTNSATASFDAFKTSYAQGFSSVAANSAAAWNALSPVGAPLPVKFGDIKGYAKDKGVQLEWNVYSEIDVVTYEIERSTDGTRFNTIGHVKAKNQDGELFYDWYDATPSAGNNYYRIRNVDIDGKSAYSSIVRISLSQQDAAAGFILYPNPVSGNHISIQATDLQKGNYKIEIYNTSGQQVYKKQFTHEGGTINQSIGLPAALQTGVYNIQLTGTGFKLAKQFLIQ